MMKEQICSFLILLYFTVDSRKLHLTNSMDQCKGMNFKTVLKDNFRISILILILNIPTTNHKTTHSDRIAKIKIISTNIKTHLNKINLSLVKPANIKANKANIMMINLQNNMIRTQNVSSVKI